MRLIEDEKAKDVIHEYFKSLMAKDASGADVYKLAVGIVSCLEHDANLLKAIDELPSAEPDIIRCKDCAYCDSDVVDAPYGMTNKVWWCDRLYAGANENLVVEPDDFCSWAERREDG